MSGIAVRGLSYVVVDAVDPVRWAEFGEQVIGMAARPLADGGIALKADERMGRIFVQPGSSDRYAATGWELADEEHFHQALAVFDRASLRYEIASSDMAAARGVLGMVRLRDPAGNQHEFGWGYRSDFRRFVSPVGVPAFVMGDLGLGHTVLPAPNFDETQAFFKAILGFHMTDLMVHRANGADGPAQRIHFMQCGNARHHSLALFEGVVPAGCVHIMVEYDSMDEVGRALDRAIAAGAKLTASLGRHVNDGVTSFYVATPGGFSIEMGWGGRLVDRHNHTVFESTSVSLWGHDFSLGFK